MNSIILKAKNKNKLEKLINGCHEKNLNYICNNKNNTIEVEIDEDLKKEVEKINARIDKYKSKAEEYKNNREYYINYIADNIKFCIMATVIDKDNTGLFNF